MKKKLSCEPTYTTGLDSQKHSMESERMRAHLRSAACVLRNVWRQKRAYRHEVKTIMHLVDFKLDPRELRDVLDNLAAAEAAFEETVEGSLDMLLCLAKTPRGKRSRRMEVRD
jgi:hypothetical protein